MGLDVQMVHRRKVRLSEAACKVQRGIPKKREMQDILARRLKGKFTRNVYILRRVYINRSMWWMFWPKT